MVTGKYIFFKRTGRLSGWIRLLVVSVTTMKSINTSGAPCSTRLSKTYLAFCTYPQIISLSHKVIAVSINPLNPELNPICYMLVLLAHHFLHVSRIRVKSLTIRLLMSYIYIYIYIYIWSAYS